MKFQKDFKDIKRMTDEYFMPYVRADEKLSIDDARMLANLVSHFDGTTEFDPKYFDFYSEIFTGTFNFNYKVHLFFIDSFTDRYKIIFIRYQSFRTKSILFYKYLVSSNAFKGDKFDALFEYYCRTLVRITDKKFYLNF